MNLNYKDKKISALRFYLFCAKINNIIIRLTILEILTCYIKSSASNKKHKHIYKYDAYMHGYNVTIYWILSF